jgi:hypothetical protein
MKVACSDEVAQNYQARRLAEPEKARGLRQLQRETRHLSIHAKNQCDEMRAGRLAGHGASRRAPTFGTMRYRRRRVLSALRRFEMLTHGLVPSRPRTLTE